MSPDTLRSFVLLRTVLTAPRSGLTVKQIIRALPPRMRVHHRSIQRDLQALASWAPIEALEDRKPYRWRRVRGVACPVCRRGMR